MQDGIFQLNSNQKQIYNILTNKTLFKKKKLDQNIFNTDLVIKLKIPLSTQQKYISKKQFVPLSRFIYNPSFDLQQAYRVAYEKLLIQSQQDQIEKKQKRNEKLIKIRNQVNFQENYQDKQQKYQIILGNSQETQIVFPCYISCKSSKIDFFSLKFNTLIYVLQKHCGFQIDSYIIEENNTQLKSKQYFIYILITQSTQNIMKAADRFRIKKQVDYSQIDLFLNQPVDSIDRPYKNHSQLIKSRQAQVQILTELSKKSDQNYINHHDSQGNFIKKSQQDLIKKEDRHTLLISVKKQYQISSQENTAFPLKGYKHNHNKKSKLAQQKMSKQEIVQNFLKDNQILQLHKRVNRNMKNKNYLNSQIIIDQESLSNKQRNKYINYLIELFDQFDKIIDEKITLNPQQKNYLYNINRNKKNPKCQKQYLLKLKRKIFFEKMKQLSQKYNYRVYDKPISFFPFILPSKRLCFSERFRGILLYEEYIVSPYGDISLFLKMDRIKIAHLVLNQYVRASNINCIGAQIFALHDNFQRFGIKSQPLVQRIVKKQIKGGINGKNLLQEWDPLNPWRSNILTLRNYFGQDTAYQLFIKNHLILYFMMIIPLHVLGFIVYLVFVIDQNVKNDAGIKYKASLYYQLIFFAVTIGFFAYFLEKWMSKEKEFKQNFIQNEIGKTFRFEYKGPFVRNNVTDSLNQHIIETTLMTSIKKFIGFFIIFCILGAECGIFFGIRMLIVKLANKIPDSSVYLIQWPHIIGYSIYFIFNYFAYKLFITNLTQTLTKFQNLPTQQLHKKSKENKNFLFEIGTELIPLIFLLVFQPFSHTSCYSSLCYDQFESYIYARYFIVIYFLVFKLSLFILMYCKSDKTSQDIKDYQITDFDKKLANYINFIKNESLKPIFKPDLNDQTLALLHYGLFASIFSISPFLGLVNMILQYSIERIQLLLHNKRPICKSQAFQTFTNKYLIIMHISIFVNNWVTFYTMAQVQYSFQKPLIKILGQNPTFQGILIFKIILILIFIGFYEIEVIIVRYIARYNELCTINNRKKRKLKEFLISKNYMNKGKAKIQKQKINPFRTIFRTKPIQLIKKINQQINRKKQLQYQTQDQLSEFLSNDRENLTSQKQSLRSEDKSSKKSDRQLIRMKKN